MPYIHPENREDLDPDIDRIGGLFTEGELNYVITKIALRFIEDHGGCDYATINTVMGVLECAKLECYLRVARPYEDLKARANGDVYNDLSDSSYGNLAWAGGFFEGEGCFYAHYYPVRQDGSEVFRTHASLSQKGEEGRVLLEQFRNVLGFGVVYPHGEMFVWKTSQVGEAEKTLNLLRPFLGRRRTRKAMGLLQLEREQEFRPLSLACSKGHEFDDENTDVRISRGKPTRVCRTCRKDYARQWRAERTYDPDLGKYVKIADNGDVY